MDPVTVAKLWLLVKPWKRFEIWRGKRKLAKTAWATHHLDEVAEEFNQEGDPVGKLAEIIGKIGGLRTSTKGGAVGLLAPLVVALPFYEQLNALAVQACQSEDGPLVFLSGVAITWVSFYITARRSTTPANPGAL